MTGLLGAIVGVLAAFGIVLVAAAVAGYEIPTLSTGQRIQAKDRSRVDAKALAVGVVGGLFVTLLTGLIGVGLLVLGAAITIPLFRAAAQERALVVNRTEALALWAEALRDYVGSHAGLRQAVVASLTTVDDVIRPEVEALATDLDQDSPQVALGRFADRIGDPTGDVLATALAVALGDTGARDIPGLLSRLASDARDEVTGIRRIAVEHERKFGTARAMAVVVAATAAAMFAVNGDYLEVYRSGQGQMVLVFVAGVALMAVWGLVRMAQPVQPLRVLNARADGTP